MKYFLLQAILGRTPRIELSVAEYENIKASWRAIIDLLNIEEEWDCLVQNYIELEMELLQSALHSMVLSHDSYGAFQDARLNFSRRLSNLLHTCRSYLDYTERHLTQIDQALGASFTALRNKEYDASFSYRFMEALRNYSQHKGAPLHGATFHASWTDDFQKESDDMGLLRHAVSATVDIEKIKSDEKFKATVMVEVDEQQLKTLDATLMTREYIEALGRIHVGLRLLLKPQTEGWKTTVREAIARYAAVNDNVATGLNLAEFTDDDSLHKKADLFEGPIKRLEHLIRRNGSLTNLRRRYVSNEIIPSKKKRRA